MTIEHLPTAASRGLPRATTTRFVPLRAGIRNVWEYDNQEFWFAGGRLLLRGPNTAGKSKALELLLPFVLDGDTSSERLDPFGSKSKTMYWNLIEFDDRPSAIGYCWVEFGRRSETGEERYVTCLVGVRATRSAGRKAVDTWFAVTPARVGDELDLAPGHVPLGSERLRDALPERSQFTTTARDHRQAVDHALFELGVDRYDALLHLLRQLRRPKLSEKLDMAKLAEYLTDALPPLERQRMEVLAQVFARLDQDTAEIETLEASLRQVNGFLDDYRAHAQVHARVRADEVRQATTRFDSVTATEKRQRGERGSAAAALSSIDSRRAELARLTERITGQLQGLDLSKVHALREVEARASGAGEFARRLRATAERDRRLADEAKDDTEEAATAAAASDAALDQADIATATAADPAGLATTHDAHRDQLRSQPARAHVGLEGAAARREESLKKVRAAAGRAIDSRQRLTAAEASLRDAEGFLAEATDDSERLTAAADGVAERFAGDVDAWVAGLDVGVPAGLADAVVDTVRDGGTPTPATLFVAARASVRDAVAGVAVAVRLAAETRDELIAQRRRVEGETDDAPSPRPGRPVARPDGCAPLWACVEFADGVDELAQAGLEAALEAAGMLDAVVTPAGEVLDPSTLDTWLVPGDALPVPWLRPAIDGPLPADAVLGALSALGRVAPDGRWSGEGIAGRWSKPVAEYIGAAARSAARRRRIESLTAEIAALEQRLAGLAEEETRLRAHEEKLRTDEAAFPPTSPLRDALRDAAFAAEAVERRVAAVDRATAHVASVREAARDVLAALAAAEEAAECRADVVDELLDAVATYRRALVSVVAAAERALRDAETTAKAAALAQERRCAAAESELAADDAELASANARGEADELRRTSGADVETIIARHRSLTSEKEAAVDEDKQLVVDRDGARDRVARAEERLATTEAERDEAERIRASALQALARLAATELATLAVGPVDRERDLTQVTAGLSFARSTYETLKDVAIDNHARDAVTNRFHRSFSLLQSQLGTDFDPYLDTSDGLDVCFATLNGSPIGLTDLGTFLDEQVRRRRETLTDEEKKLIERHLLAEVGTHLGERVHAAWTLVTRMNAQLAAHPTRGGVSLRLSWEPAPDASNEALALLRLDVGQLDNAQRTVLGAFLHERVRAAREDSEGADVVERLAVALDYRRWHRFVISRRSGGREERLTARSQGAGSGGEQAKLAHLPLFAATAAYYSSAAPSAPHLLMLDEAFAGIDDLQKADCMAMLVDLDLDVVLTNYAEFGCYSEVPALAIYHLERTPGQLGVTALRFVWDGEERREDDPFLDDLERLPEDGLFA